MIFFQVFVGILLVLLLYYLLFLRLYFHKNHTPTDTDSFPPVSIVISVQNAAHWIEQHLPAFLQQDYPLYEVVVVNDYSSDNSLQALQWLARQHPHLKVVDISQGIRLYPGKKFALSIGIKEATYEHLVFSDIDCKPASDKWLQYIVSQYKPAKDIIIGFGAYEKKKSLLNYFVRFDTFQIGLLYLSAAKIGLPYMASGRNLSYTKTLFMQHGGFSNHLNLASGDDDLFVQKIAKKKNTAICTHPDAFTVSATPASWKRWFNQKSRHFTTSDHYSFSRLLYPGLYTTMELLFPFAFVLSLMFSPNHIWTMLSLYAVIVKWLIHFIVFGLISKKWNEKILAIFAPLAEILLLLLLIIPYLRKNKFTRQWM